MLVQSCSCTFLLSDNLAKMSDTDNFLVSLNLEISLDKCHPEALKYRRDFEETKGELSENLYHIFKLNFLYWSLVIVAKYVTLCCMKCATQLHF